MLSREQVEQLALATTKQFLVDCHANKPAQKIAALEVLCLTVAAYHLMHERGNSEQPPRLNGNTKMLTRHILKLTKRARLQHEQQDQQHDDKDSK
ncbi:hypothetical protein G3R49_12560 [Shewanella sp. WXL01]|uniref:hypothetical protein n=1 Tax=Shewanella sp. WXL01 TaxID=2709721 RepID=UPI001438483F|nr:hypothetical protein [Shewanella sp. WXL01]NKF51390.1 hypothetical protein [Shewanella sp. WXL01]